MRKMEAMVCLATCLLLCLILRVSAVEKRKVYIVIVQSLPQHPYSLAFHHSEFLKDIVPPSFARESLLRSYTNFNGFSARLTEKESDKLRRLDGVESVLPNRKAYLQTTHSWDYLGFSEYLERNHLVESDSIIGVIDSGIWPESESFNDDGLGPIPAKWKGVCQGGLNFKCNRKIIGARSYIVESLGISARDNTGHGSHVASIAAGRNVRDTSYYGIAQGIAKGGVPSARLAVYKVCNPHCHSADILAAFDHAITDGVDFISISLGFKDTVDLFSNAIAIGALHAFERGILTINSAGNGGPSLGTITTDAPWILTAAASGTDREIIDKVQLGEYATLVGNGINAFPMIKGRFPIVHGTELSSTCSELDARNCGQPCLERSSMNQKVVLCDKAPEFDKINITGELAFIIPNIEVNVSKIAPYSVVHLSKDDLNLVKTYIETTTEPKAQILKSEAIYNPGAPFVAVFSSRGPSTSIPDIVKPDVTAPGVEILAAYSPLGSPSDSSFDKMSVNYTILSGTSMAAPHVTAVAVYVKSFHTNMSPSAIKSALMTTAREFNPALYPEAEFAYGSGQIVPLEARNPGLVYETPVDEYFKIWCNLSRTAGRFSARNVSCPKLSLKDINHPSMSVRLDIKDAFTVSFPRTVTNVGQPKSTYVASIEGDRSKLQVIVEPSTLQFTGLNQKLKFVVTVKGKGMKPETLKRVSLVWSDGVHKVRSPIVVYTVKTTSAGGTARAPSWLCFLSVMLIIVVLY